MKVPAIQGGETRGRLRRLMLVRAGETEPPRDGRRLGLDERPLSAEGRAHMEALRRRWEWVEGIVSSTLRRAWQSAHVLANGGLVRLDDRLRAMDLGVWSGLRDEEMRARDETRYRDWLEGKDVEIPRGESVGAFHARVDAALESLLRATEASLVVVAHEDVCRHIAFRLVGEPLPEGRPLVGERVLFTRDGEGRWQLGRRSSDPEPLRSALEREGLGAADGDVRDERTPPRHVGSLEVK